MASPSLGPWEPMAGDRRVTSGDDGLIELASSAPVEPKGPADAITGLNASPAGDPDQPVVQTGGFQPTSGSTDVLTGQASDTQVFTDKQLYIVTLEDGDRPLSDRAREVLGGVQPQALLKNLGMVTAELTSAQAAALQRRNGVLRVEADQVVTLDLPRAAAPPPGKGPGGGGSTEPTEPSSEILDWGVKAVWGDQDRRSHSFSFSNQRAFVLDTGISANTGDLNFNTTDSKDFTGSRSGFYDRQGHGTHVAGTIAAQANGRGVVGVAPNAEVVSIKVLNDRGSGTISGIIAGIDSMISVAGVGDVANMSLGGGFSQSLNDAVLKAATSSQKIRFAIAAGNSYKDVDAYSPASVGDFSKGIYTISAHDINKRNASFTNFDNFGGADVDNVAYAAPGVNITSLKIDGTTVAYNGTSMAAPHVAGLLLIGDFRYTTTSTTFGELATAYRSETTDPLAITNLG